MKKIILPILSFLILGLFIVSCSNDNECDNTCPEGQLLALNCLCVIDANTIVPHPCPDLACPADEVVTISGTTCVCTDLMSDPCQTTTCPEGFLCENGRCIVDPSASQTLEVSGQITADVTWTTGDVYILNDRVTVTAGVTLTIEPGAIVKGAGGTGANSSALLIARGAKLNAMGTAEAPIIFTSLADNILPGEQIGSFEPTVNGLWGGIIILGNAPISASNDSGELTEVQIEGIPTSDSNGLYGGNDAMDNSGTIQYVSIRHGGTNIGEGNEINGLTLGGVGAGTTIENIEIVANQDDGIEFFGGTVSVSNVLVWNCGDDSMDTDQAWNGTVSNFIIVTPTGGSAFELDGPEGNFTQGPNSFSNGVVYAGANIDHLVDWDSGTNTGISEVYFFGIEADYDPTTGIESFGGDGTGNTSNWEYTIPAGFDAATLFAEVPTGEAIEVAANANSVGPSAADFPWTWAAQSGALSSLGL